MVNQNRRVKNTGPANPASASREVALHPEGIQPAPQRNDPAKRLEQSKFL